MRARNIVGRNRFVTRYLRGSIKPWFRTKKKFRIVSLIEMVYNYIFMQNMSNNGQIWTEECLSLPVTGRNWI